MSCLLFPFCFFSTSFLVVVSGTNLQVILWTSTNLHIPIRWRGGRPYDYNRQSVQRHSAGPRSIGSQGGARGGHGANLPNVWGGPREQVPAGPPQEQHIPVRGFNAAESKGALRRGTLSPPRDACKCSPNLLTWNWATMQVLEVRFPTQLMCNSSGQGPNTV